MNHEVVHGQDVNRAFGRYRIVGEIGRGAMGVVYRAVDPLIERELAIKTLLPGMREEVLAEVRERFLREARSAGQLSHPNIVVVFDVGEQDGEAYIAMELLQGRSLREILKDQPLAFEAVAEIAAQVADALEHAHGRSIVHRDVKPANIVVLPGLQAKLTDFGMAWVPSSTMTQAGVALGTPKYMSPEQVAGQPVEPRSDVFSLGIVLYEMLTGRSPFVHEADETPFEVMDRIVGEPHPPPRGIRPEIPAAFEAILERSLAKKPGDRYPSAAEMALDLRKLAQPAGDRVRQQLVEELVKVGQDFDRSQAAALPEETTSRPGALDILREKAAELEGDKASEQARAIAALDLAMRAALQYFGEFAKLMNSVKPASGAPYQFLYLDPLAAPQLCDAEVAREGLALPAKEVCAKIRFRYRAALAEAVTTRVKDEDVARCDEYLKSLGAAFQASGPIFAVAGGLPCEIELRADYDAGTVVVEFINVRRPGSFDQRLGAQELKAALDSLGRYVLGIGGELSPAAAPKA